METTLAVLGYVGGWPLYMLGFSSTGPVAGTVASAWMSKAAVGSMIVKGSTYAVVQSVAMGGATGTAAAIGGVTTAVAGSFTWLVARATGALSRSV
eukprot:CAMPEP_0172194726 /NCGR_PEP_ID=MMETSP1050-20130122/25765_1 /TAXON_ID=233186 /ORGANISM="Cryptomonas curvata, Strain CCAP979/52" /LENGTH=95 /DNA_ID=CAMNT_0012870615 /DNA_START=9 /DNA_END=293 /DNA_ORIENTATION=+